MSAPSVSLLGHYRDLLQRWHPFRDMPPDDVDWFLARCEQRYLEPGEVLLAPSQGPATTLFLIREGAVLCSQGPGAQAPVFAYEAGDLLPVGAVLARRPVQNTYAANGDLFVLAVAAADVEALAARSAPFSDFLNQRLLTLLHKSRQALREGVASQVLAQQTLETPLAQLATQAPAHCPPQTPLREALQVMHERHIGSMLVTAPSGDLLGILTRHDLLGLVLRPGFSLDRPIGELMHAPVRSLTHADTAQDAALLMSEHAIRHVPVTRDGQLVGMVSERDLFALQRTSLQQVSTRIHRAQDLAALLAAAEGIRELARGLLVQGVQARQLTQLVSHLNDLLTRQLVTLRAAEEGIALDRVCWLALGSEGRSEQTIATDQDNALVVADDMDDAQVERVRQWAARINQALDACGYPLCKGGVMAGEPACCLRLSQWQERFSRWIDQGTPQDLLYASIFFDLRPVAGNASFAQALSDQVLRQAKATPRFLHQMAVNALALRPPLNWLGRIEEDEAGGLDLKLQGTALMVDAARILGLSQGIVATGTRERLLGAGRALGLQPREFESWASAFEFLQTLRLRVQLEPGVARSDQPNRLQVASLSDIDRRILASSLREARSLRQRIEMDWVR